MEGYRVHFLDAEQRVLSSRTFKAESDSEAVQMARQWQGVQTLEVWRGIHLVDRILPKAWL